MGSFDVSKGEFRLASVRAGTRAFPDAKKVPTLITQFCDEIDTGLQTAQTLQEKCDLAFKAHFDLISIHPFGDVTGVHLACLPIIYKPILVCLYQLYSNKIG